MLAVTDKAVEAIRRVMADAEPEVAGLRVMVVSGGCSGLKYQIGYDTAAETDDYVLEFDGFRLFVDPTSGDLLQGASMDYVEKVEGSGFLFDNPGARRSCQCGKSASCQ